MAKMPRMAPAKRLPLAPATNGKFWEKEPHEAVLYSGERKTVFEEFLPLDKRSHVEPMTDPRDGKPVYTNSAPGTEPRLRMTRIVDIPTHLEDGSRNPAAVREFVQHQGFGTNIDKVYTFREDPRVLERKRAEEDAQAEEKKLLDWARRKMAEEAQPKPKAKAVA